MSNNSTSNNYTNTQNVHNTHRMKKGGYSSLLSDQVYNKHGRTGGSNPYNNNNSTYANKQNWDKSKIYQNSENINFENKRFPRFNDLKILNEQMINLANNMQSIDSPLEVLSQGQKGEIKNILMTRIFKISLAPALSALSLSLLVIFTNHLIITLLSLLFYVFVIGRTFYYPAKLYYENVQYKTTKHAELFFEEMDYWFKISAINTIVWFLMVAIFSFIMIFFEENIINVVLSITKSLKGESVVYLINYAESISFSTAMFFLFILYISTIIVYFKFINNEKSKNEKLRQERLKNIRNETMSRVEQIQADKKEIS